MGVMRRGQVMLAQVLTVKRKDSVTHNKHQATSSKGNKETGNYHTLIVSQMLRNCLEDSSEFYSSVMEGTFGGVMVSKLD